MNGFFEGWYYRQHNGSEAVALIPALHTGGDGVQRASLQVVTGDFSCSVPFQDFCFDRSRHCFCLGGCRFSAAGMRLNAVSGELALSGALRYGALRPLDSDIMGPFRFAPLMQCRHTVFSMAHRVDGRISINGREYRFRNGTGYMEGDRGHSFPRRYVWTQGNGGGVSVMMSAAEVPYLGCRFPGVIAAAVRGGKEYRLATYTGARLLAASGRELVIGDRVRRLSARLIEGNSRPLAAPQRGSMNRTIRECAACRVRYVLKERGETVFDVECANAGFEDAWTGGGEGAL